MRVARIYVPLLILVSLLLRPIATNRSGQTVAAAGVPGITFAAKAGWSPQGIAYDSTAQRFLVTSLTEGTVTAVTDDGVLHPFIEDTTLISAIAVRVDAPRQRVFVTNADGGQSVRSSNDTQEKLAGVGIYDLRTGKRLLYVDLGALRPNKPHSAGDIALDDSGNAYVTDSLSPIIYEVKATGEASVFVEDKRLFSTTGSFLGIVYHPDGYLIVGKADDGALYKVPRTNPKLLRQILGLPGFIGITSMILKKDDKLALAQRGGDFAAVFLLASTDAWKTDRIEGARTINTSSSVALTLRDSNVYALYVLPNEQTGPDSPAQFVTYKLLKINILACHCDY
jgi:hypothetical protein